MRRFFAVFVTAFVALSLVATASYAVGYEGTLSEAGITAGLESVFNGLGSSGGWVLGLALIGGLLYGAYWLSSRGWHKSAALTSLVGFVLGVIGAGRLFSGRVAGGPFVALLVVALLVALIAHLVYGVDWSAARRTPVGDPDGILLADRPVAKKAAPARKTPSKKAAPAKKTAAKKTAAHPRLVADDD